MVMIVTAVDAHGKAERQFDTERSSTNGLSALSQWSWNTPVPAE